MTADPRGSIWRRWDLHFHTPASFDYADRSVSAEALVDGLINAGVEVVAVTDHHTIDVDLIAKMQAYAADRLTVLPGIELRSELGGSEHVHFIGIFSEACNVADVWTRCQGQLDISPAQVKKRGDERVYVPFEKGCSVIKELGGIVTVHAGRKTNTIETLTNADLVKQAVKTDLARECIQAYEVGQLRDCPGYRERVFPEIGKRMPLLMCSDNHNIAKYDVKCPMWIKADPNHQGLWQIVNEPDDRVYLGDEPPCLTHERENPTKYLDSLSFARTELAKEDQRWFEDSVPLNHGLVAVIGNKGSGKSALADILGLLGNTANVARFSFLNDKRFREPKGRLASGYAATAHWASGAKVTKRLDESVLTSELGDYQVHSPELPRGHLH